MNDQVESATHTHKRVASSNKIVGVDIGGTFTDLVLYDPETGSITVHQTPTTGANPSIGMVQGIMDLCARA